MTGGPPIQSYSPADLSIGAILNVFGRNVVLTDCDPYTKEYYRVTYGFGKFLRISITQAERLCILNDYTTAKIALLSVYG